MERRAALLLFVIGACQELASGLCWPKRQEQIHVGDNTRQKREGSVQYVDSDAGECESALGFTARAMQANESHRDGVITLDAINVRLRAQLG